jgi:hypothetical protein
MNNYRVECLFCAQCPRVLSLYLKSVKYDLKILSRQQILAQRMFRLKVADAFIIQIGTEFYSSSSNGSLIISTELKVKYRFLSVDMLPFLFS